MASPSDSDSYLGNGSVPPSPVRKASNGPTRKPSKKIFRIESGGGVIVEEAGSKKAIRVPKGTQASLLGLAGDLKGSTTSLASKGRSGAEAEAEAEVPRFVKPKRRDFFIEEPITALPGDSPPRSGGGYVGEERGSADMKKNEAEEIVATENNAENNSKAEEQRAAEEGAGGRGQRDSYMASDEADRTAAAQRGEGDAATGAAAETQAADTFDETNAEIEEEEEEAPTGEFAELAGWMELRVGGGGFFSRRKWIRRWFSITGMFIDVAVKEGGEPEERIEITPTLAAEYDGVVLTIMAARRTYTCRASATRIARDWTTALRERRASSKGKRYRNRQLIELLVSKEGGSLGITIGGGVDSGHADKTQVFITQIKPDGAAERQALLQKGDIIIDIDGQSMEGATLKEATAAMQRAPDSVTIKILRRRLSKRGGSRPSSSAESASNMQAAVPPPVTNNDSAAAATVTSVAEPEPVPAAEPEAKTPAAADEPAADEATTAAEAPAAQEDLTTQEENAAAEEPAAAENNASPTESSNPAAKGSTTTSAATGEADAADGEDAAEETAEEAEKRKEAEREERKRKLREKRMQRKESQHLEVLEALTIIDSLPEE